MQRLLGAAAEVVAIEDVEGWWRRHRDATAAFAATAERALAGGFAADRLGYAFASGYVEALARLVPALAGRKAALCATEAGGNRPRDIATRLERDGDGWRLFGAKRFATLGTHADAFVIVASEGADDAGRNRLAAVVVPAGRAGLRVEPAPLTPFVPEIPHASLALEGVRVEAGERLDGDGYERYLKPFRTVEDCHVYCALLGWLMQLARRGRWPESEVERLAALAVAARGLACADPVRAPVHIAFAGLVTQTRALLADLEPHWASLDGPTRERWQRDRPLLEVAGTARAQRREVAWSGLRGA